MSTKAPRQDAPAPIALSETQVAEFLQTNPDFLKRHPELLSVLEAPERAFADVDPAGGDVVDLQDAMLARVRADLDKQRIVSARLNQRIAKSTIRGLIRHAAI